MENTTVDPEAVDEKAREAWSRIYKGKGGPELILVHKFFEIYAEDLPPKREPAAVEDITQEDLEYAFRCIADNAAGGAVGDPGS